MKNKCLYLTLAAGFLCACGGGKDDPEPTPPDPPTPLVEKTELKISVTGIQAPDGTQENFDTGQTFGLFVVNRSDASVIGKLQSANGNQADNVKYTLQAGGTSWQAASVLYWKDQTTTVDAYAYSPWSATPASAEVTRWPVKVKTDQSREADKKSSDFLWANSPECRPGNQGILPLTFQHRLTKLYLKLTLESSVSDTYRIRSVIFHRLLTAGSCELNSGTVIPADGAPSDMLPFARTAGLTETELIIIPQPLETQNFLTVIVEDGNTGRELVLSYDLPENIEAKGGKIYTFQMTVTKEPDSLPLLDVQISDWETGGSEDIKTED